MEKKVCTKCEIEKPLTEYNKEKRVKSGLRACCKECNKANSKKYRQENREKIKAQKKKYRQENREKERTRHKKWEQENREKVRASSRLSRAKRKARKLKTQVEVITPDLLKEHWIENNIDPEKCFYCEEGLYEHLEHCVPLSRGGTHTKDNLVPSCASCNLSKGTKTADEFIEYQEL